MIDYNCNTTIEKPVHKTIRKTIMFHGSHGYHC